MSCLIETTYFKKLFVLLKKCISPVMNKKKTSISLFQFEKYFSVWKVNVKGQQFKQVRFFSCQFIYLIIKLIFFWKLHRVLFCHAILINYVLKNLTFLFYLNTVHWKRFKNHTTISFDFHCIFSCKIQHK